MDLMLRPYRLKERDDSGARMDTASDWISGLFNNNTFPIYIKIILLLFCYEGGAGGLGGRGAHCIHMPLNRASSPWMVDMCIKTRDLMPRGPNGRRGARGYSGSGKRLLLTMPVFTVTPSKN